MSDDLNDITETGYGYTGQRRLREAVGLMDYNARFYSPRMDRFISPDSMAPSFANPQSLNRYTYVMNNPMGFIDPRGDLPVCSVYDDIPCTMPSDYNISATQYNSGGSAADDVELDDDGERVRDRHDELSEADIFGGELTLEEFVGLWIWHESDNKLEIAR